jgi:hypothetical protein
MSGNDAPDPWAEDGTRNDGTREDGTRDDGRQPAGAAPESCLGGRELVPETWRALDETLADEPSAAGPGVEAAPAAAKAWLGDQRFLHGLLRALHTQDAAARESRIDRILRRIDHEPRREPTWRWVGVALAALLLACVGIWAALPARLPTADAAVQRAVAELARDVARRYRLTVAVEDARGKEHRRLDFALVAQPGGRFRVDGKLSFGTLQLGELRLGSDGKEAWVTGANGMFRHAAPLADRDRLMQLLGDVIDLGYLDVHDVVQRMSTDFDLQVAGRETAADGRSLLRIEAVRRRQFARAPLRTAWLLSDEATGLVRQLALEVEFPRGGSRRMELQYLGEEPDGLVDYRRPW